MLSFFTNFFDYNQKDLNRIQKIVDQINELEPKALKLTNADFPKETNRLKKEISSGTSLDEVLPWAFALAREAAHRTLNQRHFDVQLIAAVAMHEGKVVEQKTGEG